MSTQTQHKDAYDFGIRVRTIESTLERDSNNERLSYEFVQLDDDKQRLVCINELLLYYEITLDRSSDNKGSALTCWDERGADKRSSSVLSFPLYAQCQTLSLL